MSSLSRLLRLAPRRLLSSSVSPPPLNPNPNHNQKTLNTLYNETDLDRFLSLFRSLSTPTPLPIPLYTVAVRRLSAAGRPSDAADLLRSLASLSPSFPSHEPSSASLISLYGKAQLPDLALDTFHRLPSLGGPRTVLSFNTLLAALDPASAIREFSAIPASDPSIVPDVVSYTTLIRAFCESGDLDAAVTCLNTMEEKGVEPNDVSFNTVLHALYKNDSADEAEAIWGRMEEKGCGPNVRSYNYKMKWLVSKGRVEDAVEMFQEMEGRGLKPDGFSISELIVGYCKDGNLEEAKRMFREFAKRSREVNSVVYEALLPRMCEAGDFDSAMKLCKESMKKRCYIGVEILQGVVDGLVGVSRIEDARRLVEIGWSKRYSRESLVMPPECLALPIESKAHEKKSGEAKEGSGECEELGQNLSETNERDGNVEEHDQKINEAHEMDHEIEGDLVISEDGDVGEEDAKKESISSGGSAKIGIIVKSFDKPKYMGAFGIPLDKNRVKLPTTRSLITVLRSPHIDKKSREQFEIKIRKEYIVIKCHPHELQKKYFWFKRTRILGAQFELVFSYKTRLDMSRLKRSV